VETIASNGIIDFILVTSPEDKLVIAHFHDNPLPGINIHFIPQSEPKGMAHALMCAKDYLNRDFILSACDSLLPSIAYANLFNAWNEQPRAAAVLALMNVASEKINQTAVVQIENERITRIIEKPVPGQAVSNIASLPIYIFQPVILDYLRQIKPSSRGEYELQDAIQAIIEVPAIVRGVLIDERLNLTSAQDLLEINLHFLEIEKPQFIHDSVVIGKNVALHPPYWIGSHTTIGDHCNIGPDVYIESDCHIEHHCLVTSSLLLNGSRLKAYQEMHLEISK
jgi:glucose-1-phosphate thymidylyltransferase